MRPFQQMSFSALPETPRLPHGFYATEGREHLLETSPFSGTRMHYRVHGSGPPLLLIHGLMTAGYSWRYMLEPLGAHYTLYIPDLPGSGRSECADRDYHPDHVADAIGAFIRELGLTSAPVIGNSMGGYLCMRLAMRDPDVMSRLVNLHSPGVPLLRLHALRTALSLPGSFSLLRWMVHHNPQRWVHRNVHYYDESLKSLEEAREYGAPLSTKEGVNAFGRILYESLNPAEMSRFVADLEALERFPIPLQMLYAEKDPMVPPVVGDRLRALVPDAEFVVLKEASHFAHVDAPEQFVPPVVDFLSRTNDG